MLLTVVVTAAVADVVIVIAPASVPIAVVVVAAIVAATVVVVTAAAALMCSCCLSTRQGRGAPLDTGQRQHVVVRPADGPGGRHGPADAGRGLPDLHGQDGDAAGAVRQRHGAAGPAQPRPGRHLHQRHAPGQRHVRRRPPAGPAPHLASRPGQTPLRSALPCPHPPQPRPQRRLGGAAGLPSAQARAHCGGYSGGDERASGRSGRAGWSDGRDSAALPAARLCVGWCRAGALPGHGLVSGVLVRFQAPPQPHAHSLALADRHAGCAAPLGGEWPPEAERRLQEPDGEAAALGEGDGGRGRSLRRHCRSSSRSASRLLQPAVRAAAVPRKC